MSKSILGLNCMIPGQIIGATLIGNVEKLIKIGKVFMKKNGRLADKLTIKLFPH